jgi:hypothetical protein
VVTGKNKQLKENVVSNTSLKEVAEQALSIMVLDFGYEKEPVYGHSPMRHQFMWSCIEKAIGQEGIDKNMPMLKRIMAEEEEYKKKNLT